MAIARSSSKIESRDPLVGWIVRTAHFIQAKRRMLAAALVAVLVIAIAAGVFVWYRGQREAAAHQALAQAVAAFRPDATGAAPKPDEGVKLLQEVADKYAGSEAAEEALVRLGNQQWDAGKADAAGEAFGRYLRDYRGGRFVMMAAIGRAYALETKGDLEGAARTLSEALERSKGTPLAGEASVTLGRLYEAGKKPDDALRVYNQVVEKYPQTSWAQTATVRMSALKAK